MEILQKRIQAASIDSATVQRYLHTLQAYEEWLTSTVLPMSNHSLGLWLTYMAAAKQLAPSTLQQYHSHISTLGQIGIIPQLKAPGLQRFITGMTAITDHQILVRLLLPSTVLKIFLLKPRSLIVDAILFQVAVGLRGGQMLLITPSHMLNNASHMIVPPYKRCKVTTMLPLLHVNPTIITRFLSHATDDHAPIIPWIKSTYARKFAKLLKDINIRDTSHAARHTFASIQFVLTADVDLIGGYLIHQDPSKTTKTYIHSFPPAEIQIIYKHPDLFVPLSTIKIVSSSLTAHQQLLGY